MTAAVIGILGALTVAILGAVASYLTAQRLAMRQERLTRVNRQLSELYGPMLATLEANRRAYDTFLAVHRGGASSFFNSLPPPSETDIKLWRLWTTTVFQPGNRRVFELIIGKADLLTGTEMPECLIRFCAHVSSYEATIERWRIGDFSQNWAGVRHPRNDIDDYARHNFAVLRAEQAQLLSLTSKLGPSRADKVWSVMTRQSLDAPPAHGFPDNHDN